MTYSNSQGAARVTTAAQFAAYDKLPPTARAALARALFDWATPSIYRAWNSGAPGFKTGAQIARAVRGWDQDAHLIDVKNGKVAPTIYEALRHKLGREPSNAELKADIGRILDEGLIERASAGKLPHQRKRRAS